MNIYYSCQDTTGYVKSEIMTSSLALSMGFGDGFVYINLHDGLTG